MAKVTVIASVLVKSALLIEYFTCQAHYSINALSHLTFTVTPNR